MLLKIFIIILYFKIFALTYLMVQTKQIVQRALASPLELHVVLNAIFEAQVVEQAIEPNQEAQISHAQ